MRYRWFTIVAVPLAIATMSGCGSSGTMTCNEYGELDYDDRDEAITSMIREHDLRPYSNPLGIVAIQEDVHNFCGISLNIPSETLPATMNLDRAIEQAIDWEAYTEE
ncbi:MAG: hypothetical protein Q4Q03_04905 [Bowdeniella nasicola]|nr:hypothetical protein [Bowdeniella nasicola]